MKSPLFVRFLRSCSVIVLVAWLQAEPIRATGSIPPDEAPQDLTHGSTERALDPSTSNFFEREGEPGFHHGTTEMGFALGTSLGSAAFGSREAHDLALTKLYIGRVISDVIGERRWYRGDLEAVGELFGGGQYRPDVAYLFGFTPLLRYNFLTDSVWLPFVDAGAGVTATDIGHPDLSTTFQFNLQAGVGVRRWLTRNSALVVQYRFLHISDAGIAHPNNGVNSSVFYAGVSWFF